MLNLWKIGVNLPNPESYHPDNYEQVYSEFSAYDLDRTAIFALHGLMSAAIKPSVSFGEGVEEQAGQWLAEGKPMVALANHQHYIDHFVDVAAVRSETALRPIAQRGYPLAKVEYFDIGENPSRKASTVSFLYRTLGAWPAYRPKDLERTLSEPAQTDIEKRKILAEALTLTNRAMIGAGVLRLARGQVVYGYPEGTRKLGDWSEIGEVYGAFSRMLAEAGQQGIKPALLIGARSYGTRSQKPVAEMNWRSPHLHFGLFASEHTDDPRQPPFRNKSATTKLIAAEMQKSLDAAHTMARAK